MILVTPVLFLLNEVNMIAVKKGSMVSAAVAKTTSSLLFL